MTYFRVRKSGLPALLPTRFREELSPLELLGMERSISQVHLPATAKLHLLTAHAYPASHPVRVTLIFHKATHA
jgi:hypothetical protein